MKKIIKSGYFKVFIVTVIVVASASTGYLLVRAQSASDSFLNTNFIAETWRTTVNTSEGKVTLEERSCDDNNWFCAANNVCQNELGDGDYLIVKRESVEPNVWKTESDLCHSPHCEVIGGRATLVQDNTIDFSTYPARDACKAVGGRLPSINELKCIYEEFGSSFDYILYTSASECCSAGGRALDFSDGTEQHLGLTSTRESICVKGW